LSHSLSHPQTSLALDDVRRNLKRLATGTNNNKQQESQQHTPTSAAVFVSFPATVANGNNNNEHEAPGGGGVMNEHDVISQILDRQLVEALERASSYSEANAILHRLHTSRQQRAMKRASVEEQEEEEKRNGGGG
jgi:predicted ribosome quality control (RQC) complex YloA/Tae2 family protein